MFNFVLPKLIFEKPKHVDMIYVDGELSKYVYMYVWISAQPQTHKVRQV